MQIYLTTNLINGKKYIGQDSKSDPNYLGSGKYFKNALKKYGSENFSKEILEDNIENKDLLDSREKFYIEKLDAVNSKNFYNIAFGGEGGDVFSGLTKEEQDDLRIKNSNSSKLYWRSLKPEDKLKRIAEHAEKIKKVVYQFDKDGTFIRTYESLESALEESGLKSKGNLTSALKGNRNYWNNHRWSYTSKPNGLIPEKKLGRIKGSKDKSKRKYSGHINRNVVEVLVYKKDGTYITTYDSYNIAAEKLNISKSMLHHYINSRRSHKIYDFKKGDKKVLH